MILASPGVDPKAFDIAEQTIDTMFATNSLKDYLVAEGAYIVIRDGDERVTDLPEFACLASRYGPGFIDHICGVADDADYPIATVSELDLLGDREGPCRGLNVLYHEIGHLVQTWAIGPADYYDVKQFYQDALSAGKYSGAYAGSNANEYFAEGTQAYFLSVDPRDLPFAAVTGRKAVDPAAVAKTLSRAGAAPAKAVGKAVPVVGSDFAFVYPVDAKTVLLATGNASDLAPTASRPTGDPCAIPPIGGQTSSRMTRDCAYAGAVRGSSRPNRGTRLPCTRPTSS